MQWPCYSLIVFVVVVLQISYFVTSKMCNDFLLYCVNENVAILKSKLTKYTIVFIIMLICFIPFFRNLLLLLMYVPLMALIL